MLKVVFDGTITATLIASKHTQEHDNGTMFSVSFGQQIDDSNRKFSTATIFTHVAKTCPGREWSLGREVCHTYAPSMLPMKSYRP